MTWRDEAAALPDLAPAAIDLAESRTALVVVDMQYVDAHRGHALGASLQKTHPLVWDYYFTRIEQLVVPNIQRLLTAFRGVGLRVLHLTVGPELPDGSDLLPARRADTTAAFAAQVFPKGSFEHGILPELVPQEGELVINKTSRSAFNSTGFEHALRNMGIEALVLAGVMTSSCVESTARDAVDRGFRAVLVEDAAAELDQASHDATLKQFVLRWGQVLTTDETLAAIPSRTDSP